MLTALELHERARVASRAWRFRPAKRLLLKGLERAETPDVRAMLEGSLGLIEAELGDRRTGLRLVESALTQRAFLPEAEVGKLFAQRALIHTRLGDTAHALADFATAIPLLADDVEEYGRARMNRGNLFLHQGSIQEALDDFEESVTAFSQAGLRVATGKVTHNLGYAAMMAGQLARGLSLMDQAAPILRGESLELAAISDQDRGEALLAAGMHDESRRNLAGAITLFGRRKWPRAQAEAELVLARGILLDAPADARRLARTAGRRFARLAAPTRGLQCQAVEIASAIEQGGGSARVARDLAKRLAAQGLQQDAAWLRLYAAKAAHREGQSAVRVSVRSDAPLNTRLLAYEVRAEFRTRPRDALRVLRAGLSDLHQWQSTFGSLDLQTATASHGERLAERGLALAVGEGDPRLVYEWVEWLDAVSGRIVPVRPPADPEAAADLTELRVLSQRRPEPGTVEARRQDELVQRVRRRAWADRGSAALHGIVSLAELQAHLADTGATLLAPLSAGGVAWLLVVTPKTRRLVDLGDVTALRTAISGLTADLDMAAAELPEAIAHAVRAGLLERLARLDSLLFGPVDPGSAHRMVINPTGIFSGLPWTLLPSLAGRSVTIPRSASAWVAARGRPHQFATAGFAAGPRLPRSGHEVLQAAEYWPDARVLTGSAATADAVGVVAGQVDLLHLAAHGHHVAENPLFSTLELVDGPWFGYDLDQLPQVPETVILSACELGATTIRRGDELLGLTTAWLHAGARCVIASPASVSDEVAAAILPDMHAELAAGSPPADALAAATAKHPDMLSTFQCYGAGW